MSSPDWRVCDARRPEGGGARSKKGRGQREVSSLLFEPGENERESVRVSCWRTERGRNCECRCVGSSSERESVFPRVTRSGAPAFFPPLPHRDSGAARAAPPKTRSDLSGVRRERRAARAGRGTTPEGLEAAVAKWDDANQGSDHFLFLWALCK